MYHDPYTWICPPLFSLRLLLNLPFLPSSSQPGSFYKCAWCPLWPRPPSHPAFWIKSLTFAPPMMRAVIQATRKLEREDKRHTASVSPALTGSCLLRSSARSLTGHEGVCGVCHRCNETSEWWTASTCLTEAVSTLNQILAGSYKLWNWRSISGRHCLAQ